MALEQRSVSVLGSTGSIGTSTVDLLLANPDRFRVRALAGGRNVALLAQQARQLNAEVAVIADTACLPELERLLAGTGIATAAGSGRGHGGGGIAGRLDDGGDHRCGRVAEHAGGDPSRWRDRAGKQGGAGLRRRRHAAGGVRDAGATLLPVDSEHNAIFQAMAEGNADAVERIVLTASGGPFRTATSEEMTRATPEAALRHPTWTMGAKISIDSATMFNKGLELIEAARLFDLTGAPDRRPGAPAIGGPRYRPLARRQHAGATRLARHAHPDRPCAGLAAADWRHPRPRLDLAALGQPHLLRARHARFPALRLARDALRAGGGGPTILSAANEVAVEAFLNVAPVGFTDIAALVEAVMDRLGSPAADTLDDVMALDGSQARRATDRRHCRPPNGWT